MVKMWNAECGMGNTEFGKRHAEFGYIGNGRRN